SAASGFCGSQCFHAESIAMPANNPNVIWLGGSNASAVATCGSHILRRSADAGATFQTSEAGHHEDVNAIVFAPSDPNVIYAGSDGGIWRSGDGGTTWVSRNTAGFSATQFQSLAVHPTDRKFSIGGTQDNGTNLLRTDATWLRV